jgi:antirestriction protein ArdC
MTNLEAHQVADDEPSTVHLMLHAAALVLAGSIYAAVGEAVARIMSWLNVHVDESLWIRQANAYNQHAYRVLRPWWERVDSLTRWHHAKSHAEQEGCQRAEQGDHDD